MIAYPISNFDGKIMRYEIPYTVKHKKEFCVGIAK